MWGFLSIKYLGSDVVNWEILIKRGRVSLGKVFLKTSFSPPELCKKKKTNWGILCSGCKLIHTTVMLTNVTPVNCRRHHNMMCTSIYLYILGSFV